ncbi:MAG: hypothetical protein HY863_10930 [Chloroflexi bacterium]|nr:hypothetical protein [Chloroflexota bacterium]
MTKNIFMYWSGIIKQAWGKTKAKLGIAGMLLDFFIAVSGVFLYHYFTNDGNYSIGEIVFGLVVFSGIILLVEFWYIITTPALQDIEQKEIITKNNMLELRVGIGEEDLNDNIYLIFQSFYEDVDIAEMFVQVEEFFVSNLNAKDFFEKNWKG